MRFTASDRLQNFPSELARSRISELTQAGASAIERTFSEMGRLQQVDELDGLRMQFESGEILHVRASGNAPELRFYVEAASAERAQTLLGYGLERVAAWRPSA
jgi:phosphomannomutase